MGLVSYSAGIIRIPLIISAFLLSWDAVANASGYRVYWGTVSRDEFAGDTTNAYYPNFVDFSSSTLGANASDFPGIGTGTRYFAVVTLDVSGVGDPADAVEQIRTV